MNDIKIIDTTPENIYEYGVCGYKKMSTPGFPEKVQWAKSMFDKGLKIKTVYSEKDGVQGMIEYLPGEYSWRPVMAAKYMFIHCLFVGFRREYKGRGLAAKLLEICEEDAKKENMHGVAVVTRKGAFMAGKEIFVKRGYEMSDRAPSDFELMVKRFSSESYQPYFLIKNHSIPEKYQDGLIIIRTNQCPYTVKNVNEIRISAEEKYGIKPEIITLETHKEAQQSPCPFGAFCILYNGKVLAEHPISNKRFCNIMDKVVL
ncbi:GCN5-related N-acetyltransferase [Chloroherpeton thalassium ATCC 35110]|uniref:GCN5-related N-acetyltransferase n=1 Tax=Chloroherpeton thalassium (strain ATCC 35110 / GB-78) TaxID=517418 RepID=B3QXK5_CHLT3|nr:GNAT family N-acetyltransferase [Chloroherpeton thalassium]ACF14920.1 GCN5-related N-acetyltransferase [Chloroherpeton thalassium ATCC 35110]